VTLFVALSLFALTLFGVSYSFIFFQNCRIYFVFSDPQMTQVQDAVQDMNLDSKVCVKQLTTFPSVSGKGLYIINKCN